MTSSDLVDTALALQIQEAGRVLRAALARAAARRVDAGAGAPAHADGRAHATACTPSRSRSGSSALLWCEELGRDLDRAAGRRSRTARSASSAAPWARSRTSTPAIEKTALASLGLTPEPVANQVVQRDRHAALLCALAVLGGTLEKIALEIRHLMRTEVREAEEPFGEKQKGSSAMPHKRNPVRCERVCGLARLLRGYALAGFENQALWHERDISHSSVERVIAAGRVPRRATSWPPTWPACSRACACTPSACARTSRRAAGWCSRSACCWR